MLSKYTSLVTLPTLDHKPSNDTGHVIKWHVIKVYAADSLTVECIISYISLRIVADILAMHNKKRSSMLAVYICFHSLLFLA